MQRSACGQPMQDHFLPAADIIETAAELLLLADMPGVSPGNFTVTVEGDVLTVSGRIISPVHEHRRLMLQEFLSGDYYRQFRLPPGFDASRIEAVVKDGVLTIRLPRAGHERARRIPVVADTGSPPAV